MSQRRRAQVITGAADGYWRMARQPAMVVLDDAGALASGLANLHNARQASSQLLTLVGIQPTVGNVMWEPRVEALDGAALGATVGDGVAELARHSEALGWRTASAAELREHLDAALRRMRAPCTPHASRIATLLVPADWRFDGDAEPLAPPPPPPPPPPFARMLDEALPPRSLADPDGSSAPGPATTTRAYLTRAAEAMARGGGALYLSGDALIEPLLTQLGAVADATGAMLIAINTFARVERGAGVPRVERLPYFPAPAESFLRRFRTLFLIGAATPVAQFGYDGHARSSVVPLGMDEYDLSFADLHGAVAHVASLLPSHAPRAAPRAAPPAPRRELPSGPITASRMCEIVAALQPEDAIVVDESLTSGGAYWDASSAAPRFTHLTLTGGAIGFGIPCSLGCAIACPARRVINLQADGSALYTAAGLWSLAHEKCHVTTVICQNNSYGILRLELAMQRCKVNDATHRGTALDDPPIDWPALAAAHRVPAVSVRTCDDFARELAGALVADGPRLIAVQL